MDSSINNKISSDFGKKGFCGCRRHAQVAARIVGGEPYLKSRPTMYPRRKTRNISALGACKVAVYHSDVLPLVWNVTSASHTITKLASLVLKMPSFCESRTQELHPEY